jgi:hypothetical protein
MRGGPESGRKGYPSAYGSFPELAIKPMTIYGIELRLKYDVEPYWVDARQKYPAARWMGKASKGSGFVSINSLIHDVNKGCSYGTTWMSRYKITLKFVLTDL